MARISEIDERDEKPITRQPAGREPSAPRQPTTEHKRPASQTQASTASIKSKEVKEAEGKGDSLAQTDPFVTFFVVSLVGFQLALQTELLAPIFNSLPLTRWSRWVGVLGAVLLTALLPNIRLLSSLRALFVFAALSCAASAAVGRYTGNFMGRRIGPEWGPAAASALLSFGSLFTATRLALSSRKSSPVTRVLHGMALTGILWSGEKLGRTLLELMQCAPCRRVNADPEISTLVLAFVFFTFALIAYAPEPGAESSSFSRQRTIIMTVPLLVMAAFVVFRRPSAPFTTPDGSVQILYSAKSNSGRIVVGERTVQGHTYRYLRADHSLLGGQWLQQIPDGRGGHRLHLSDSIFSAFPQQEVLLLAERGNVSAPVRPAEGESALVIGLGIGTAATQFMHRGIQIEVVEYDKVVYDAAVKYFSYGARRPRSYTITDGAKYVRSAAMAKRGKTDVPRWNYVVQDCFSAGELPVELFTQEFWYNVQDIITDDGLVVMNFAGVIDALASRKVIRTLVDVFPQCRAFADNEVHPDVPCNIVFVCSRRYDPLLTFRAPTPEDYEGSGLRRLVYTSFLKREVPLDRILRPEDWKNRRMILHSGNKLGYWNDAVKTWNEIEYLFDPQTWTAY